VTLRRHRRSVRLLILDGLGRVLLMRYEDEGRQWWTPPGGGLEAGESVEDAARREALEELGLTRPAVTPLWSQTVEFTFRRQPLRVLESFVLVRLAGQTIDPDRQALQAQHDEGILETRWWSLEELERTSEQVFPERLASRLRQLA
jgi:ADP-ribose pyrophosphatase YjhB (NUDIX family)